MYKRSLLAVSGSLCLIFFLSQQALADSGTLKSPLVSANGLFLYQHSNQGDEAGSTTPNGIDLQEAELAFYADVDPYSKFVMLMTIVPQYTPDANGHIVESWVVEPEELYAESTALSSVTMRIGKFKAAMGKHNGLHTHAFPFVDQPLANQYLLGPDALQDVGASAAVLVPFSWYSEVTVQYLGGKGTETENIAFHSSSPDAGVELVHWKNLLDLNDSATIEGGISLATGRNASDSNTNLFGLDLTYKWRPTVGGRYHSAIAAIEYIRRDYEQPVLAQTGDGTTLWGQYQLDERWFALARYENLSVAGGTVANTIYATPVGVTNRESLALGFNATEFSSYKFEVTTADGPHNTLYGLNGASGEKKVYLQANFTIGAHPAHAY